MSDFEVLLRLSRAPNRRMWRVDLAHQVFLSASGVTRLLERLECQGFVERASCYVDRRVVYAVVTVPGLDRLRDAATTHFRQIDAILGARLDEDELSELTSLLDRLGTGETPDCSPG